MKRTLFSLLILACCLTVFSGCSARQTRHVVKLTDDNLWQYVAVSPATDFVAAASDAPLTCSIRGVLDYALYENVILTFEVVYYKPEAPTVPDQKSYTISVALNSAGEAEFEVPYHGLALIKNGTGAISDYGASCELYWFNRSLRLKAVSGSVIYTA